MATTIKSRPFFLPKLTSFIFFSLFCSCVTYWILEHQSLKPAVIPSISVENTPTTQLSGAWLKLFGKNQPSQPATPMPTIVFQGSIESARDTFIIALIDGKNKILRIGDSIAPNIYLTGIRGQTLVFTNDGQEVVVAPPQKNTPAGRSGGASVIVPAYAKGGWIQNEISPNDQPNSLSTNDSRNSALPSNQVSNQSTSNLTTSPNVDSNNTYQTNQPANQEGTNNNYSHMMQKLASAVSVNDNY